jgi:hypothetical protein
MADSDLKSLLLFILDKRSIQTVHGCYILRLANGNVTKIDESSNKLCGLRSAKNLYIVDREGFDIFKDMAPDCIVTPAVVDKDVLNRWDLHTGTNVRQLDGTVVDSLLKSRISVEENVKSFNDAEIAWLLALYKYVNTQKFTVASYKRHPMLPLSNKHTTFVSMAFWEDPRLLPPIDDGKQRQITDQFPDLHILADLNLEAMKQLATVPSSQRFLRYLYNLVNGNCPALEQIFRDKNLTTDSIIEVQSTEMF